MLTVLVQIVVLAASPRAAAGGRAAAPACSGPDVASATLAAGYAPALDDTTFARCSADPEYLFQNDGSDVTKSFLLESTAPLRDRGSFERAVHQLAVAVNGLWLGRGDGNGAAALGPCGDDFIRFVSGQPAGAGEAQRLGTAPIGALTVLAVLRALGFDDERIWGPFDGKGPSPDATISDALRGGATEGTAVGRGDDGALEMLRVGNVVELDSRSGTDWLLVASRPQAVGESGEREWRFMAIRGGGSAGAQVIRTAKMRARFVTGRWRFEGVGPCEPGAASGSDRALRRFYDTWDVFRTQAYPLPPRLPMGALLDDLPLSGEWSPWPDLFQPAAAAPPQRQVRPARSKR